MMNSQSLMERFDDLVSVPTLAQQLAWHAQHPTPPEPPAPPPGPRYFPPMSAENLVRHYPTMTHEERQQERERINTAARFVTDAVGHFIV